jgi:hypothetical protein
MDGGREKMEFENSCCVVIIPRTKKYYNKNAVCGDWHKIRQMDKPEKCCNNPTYEKLLQQKCRLRRSYRQNCKLKNVVHVIWKKSLQLFFIWCILRSR